MVTVSAGERDRRTGQRAVAAVGAARDVARELAPVRQDQGPGASGVLGGRREDRRADALRGDQRRGRPAGRRGTAADGQRGRRAGRLGQSVGEGAQDARTAASAATAAAGGGRQDPGGFRRRGAYQKGGSFFFLSFSSRHKMSGGRVA